MVGHLKEVDAAPAPGASPTDMSMSEIKHGAGRVGVCTGLKGAHERFRGPARSSMSTQGSMSDLTGVGQIPTAAARESASGHGRAPPAAACHALGHRNLHRGASGQSGELRRQESPMDEKEIKQDLAEIKAEQKAEEKIDRIRSGRPTSIAHELKRVGSGVKHAGATLKRKGSNAIRKLTKEVTAPAHEYGKDGADGLTNSDTHPPTAGPGVGAGGAAAGAAAAWLGPALAGANVPAARKKLSDAAQDAKSAIKSAANTLKNAATQSPKGNVGSPTHADENSHMDERSPSNL